MADVARHLFELLYFMAPAYLANMAPPFVRYWKGWNRPIDEPSLGSHKTVVGFALGVVVALLATALQAAIQWPSSLVDYSQWPWLGLGFGLGAMLGDSLKSYFKRRRGRPPGSSWIPFDQLDFVLGALVAVSPVIRLTPGDLATILAVSFLGDIAINQIAYRLGIKSNPW